MEAECVKRHFLNIPISHGIFLQLTPAPSWPKGKMTPTTTQDLMRSSDLASSEAPSFLQMFFRHYFMGKPVVASRNFGTCFIRLYMLGWLRIDPHWVSWDFWSKRPFFKKLNNQTTFSLIKDTLILALLIIMVVHAERIHFFIGISSCLYLPLSLSEAA